MSDRISRQAVIDSLWDWSNHSMTDAEAWHLRQVVGDVKSLPSAEPEIIRRKDCKHYRFADNRAFGMPVKMCEWFGFEDVDDDDFCSRAERRPEHE